MLVLVEPFVSGFASSILHFPYQELVELKIAGGTVEKHGHVGRDVNAFAHCEWHER